jgi:hypothetical protein
MICLFRCLEDFDFHDLIRPHLVACKIPLCNHKCTVLGKPCATRGLVCALACPVDPRYVNTRTAYKMAPPLLHVITAPLPINSRIYSLHYSVMSQYNNDNNIWRIIQFIKFFIVSFLLFSLCTQLVKKLPVMYRSERFITVLQEPAAGPSHEPVEYAVAGSRQWRSSCLGL